MSYARESSVWPVSLPTAGPAARSVTVINARLDGLLESLFQLLLFSSVTSLTLSGTSSQTYDQLFKLIASYPLLIRLYLLSPFISNRNTKSAVTPALPFLHEIDVLVTKTILEWLNSAPSPLPIARLCLNGGIAEDAPLARRLMHTIRASLVILELYSADSLDKIDYDEHVLHSQELSQLCDLSFLVSLRALHTSANCWQFWDSPALLRCFASIPRLETLVILLGLSLAKTMSDEMAEAEPFEQLEDVLCTPYLKRVEFQSPNHKFGVEGFVRKRMKKCDEMHALFFL